MLEPLRRRLVAAGPVGPAARALGAMVAAWVGYGATLAPGLTWAHHGADGGDLLAAAATNGVPHPSGYPLYTVLLQGWLAAGRGLGVQSPAWLGNSFSAFAAGLSVGVTVLAAYALLGERPFRPLWAAVAGMAWAVAPLVWSQALITEVYALHGLLVALLGTAAFVGSPQPLRTGVLLGLALAHHLTSALLWPALVYALRRAGGTWRVTLGRAAGMSVVAALVAAVCYARIPLVAGQGAPVNWGYAVDWAGFWWLAGGEAYRHYLFALTPAQLGGRLLGVGSTLVEQVTPLGLAALLAGLPAWERLPVLRGAALLWVLPVSLYAAAYATVDSRVYLLPVVWLSVLWLAQGCAAADQWLRAWLAPCGMFKRIPRATFAGLVCGALVVVAVWRLPALSLRDDREATQFLTAAAQAIPSHSVVISGADAPTFALWYGAWAGGELDVAGQDLVLLNADLLQFGWYRRLMHDLYPAVVAPGASLEEVVATNRELRPILVTEPELVPGRAVTPAGPLWRLE